MKLQVIRKDSSDKDFQQLILLLDKELNSRYGVLQAQYDKYNIIESIDTVVIVYLNNTPIGCGCFKSYQQDTAEIKRMFVRPEKRGAGVADMILLELEKWASERGFTKTVLETGIRQPEAIRFYTRNGYSPIENYGQYIGNTNSVCMQKNL